MTNDSFPLPAVGDHIDLGDSDRVVERRRLIYSKGVAVAVHLFCKRS